MSPILVKQPTAKPTRKLNAAAVGVAALAVIQVVVHNFWPDWDQAYLWGALAPVAVYLAGYFVHDEANVDLASYTE